jgi:hypothetical protein
VQKFALQNILLSLKNRISMPIKPENKDRYPKNWTEIVQRIRARSKGLCEKCGLPNHAWVNSKTREICLQDEENAIRIVLTVAHLDHTPENCEDDNLRDWCQKCHNSYDAPHRKQTRKTTLSQIKSKGNLVIDFISK